MSRAALSVDERIVELLAHIAARLDELVDGRGAAERDHDAEPELLTVAELATLLRVNRRTLRELRHEKGFPRAITVGRSPRWKRTSIDRWLAQREAA